MTRTSLLTVLIALGAGAAAISATAVEAKPGGGRFGGERPTFETLDANGDGMITVEDIEAARVARFAAIDTNGDGSVSLEEFQAQAAADAGERAARMFERLDADGDGVLSEDVLAGGRGAMGERMIERLDTDGDGAISAEEFAEIESRGPGRRFGGRHGERGNR